VVDLDVVRDNFRAFEPARCRTAPSVYYAVKANPAPEILRLLAELGSSFDTASVAEIEMALDAGAPPSRISFGNTIKKERDIARAFELGIRLFAVDCRRGREDCPRRPRRAACSAASCATAKAPNGRCRASSAACRNGRRRAAKLPTARPRGLWRVVPRRLAAGEPDAWDRALATPSASSQLAEEGHRPLRMVNMGGGFPTRTCGRAGLPRPMARRSSRRCPKHFGNNLPETIIEPGRGMVGDAGVIKAEVVLISKKADNDNVRWVYPRHRQVRRSRRDDGRGDPLPDP
jgi:ornithine decarboxylase